MQQHDDFINSIANQRVVVQTSVTKKTFQGHPDQGVARRPGRDRRVVFSVCEDSGHGSSEGEGRVSEVEEGEEEEEYSYVYTSRVCPAQLIRQQGEEEGEEENIYEEIGLHLPLAGPAHPADVQQQSLDASQSHLHLYRSIRSNPSIGRGSNWMKSNLKENL